MSLDTSSLSRLNIAWKQCIKRIWKISPRTHSNLLPLISRLPALQNLQLSRFATFSMGCLRSKNPLITYLFTVANQSHSAVGSNIHTLLSSLHLHDTSDLTIRHKQILNTKHLLLSDDLKCLATAIFDLCVMRDSKDFSMFSKSELSQFIFSLFTS